jgi:hypothetical protein
MMLPAPDVFASIRVVDTTGTSCSLVTNQALSIHGPAAATAAMIAGFERWRLAYAGVSVYFDGPTLSDQGTVIAAQYPVEVQEFAPGTALVPLEEGALEPHPLYRTAPYHCIAFQDSDFPTYGKLQVMPNAYFGQAKEGVYMPLKLSSGHSDWHSQRDVVYDASSLARAGDTDTLIVPGLEAAGIPMVTGAAGYPWYGMDNLAFDWSGIASTAGTWAGDLHCALCNSGVGGICFQNVSVNAGLTFYFRYGFEVQCQPTSPFASWLSVSPLYDPAALRDYFRIVRELKDAYPVEFNDLGRLWEVIKSAAGALADVSGFGGLLRPIGGAVMKTLERVSKGLPKKPKPVRTALVTAAVPAQKRDAPAAAVRQRAQQELELASAMRASGHRTGMPFVGGKSGKLVIRRSAK